VPLLQDLSGQTVLDIAFFTDNKKDKNIKRRIYEFIKVIFPVQKESIFKEKEEIPKIMVRFERYWNNSKINYLKGSSSKLNTSLA